MENNFLNNTQDIEHYLNQHKIKNYELVQSCNYGYVINVEGNVDFSYSSLNNIPVKFNSIAGYFHCNNNNLTNLEFCPKNVGTSFNCSYNKLVSLDFGPETVGIQFNCMKNLLTTLRGCPKRVGSNFFAGYNDLEDLFFIPDSVGGLFYVNDNPKLKKIQNHVDFDTIEQIHLKHKVLSVLNEKKVLDKELLNIANNHDVKKIKI